MRTFFVIFIALALLAGYATSMVNTETGEHLIAQFKNMIGANKAEAAKDNAGARRKSEEAVLEAREERSRRMMEDLGEVASRQEKVRSDAEDARERARQQQEDMRSRMESMRDRMRR